MEEKLMDFVIEDANFQEKYYFNYMPDFAYHYTDAAALEGILKSRTMWITKSDFLNDKTEYDYGMKLIKEVFNLNSYIFFDKRFFTQLMRGIKMNLSRSFIFSASLNGDSVNLWSNYSRHDGYNIRFDLREMFGRMLAGGIYVNSNKTLEDGTGKKYEIKLGDQGKIKMSFNKVLYDEEKQRAIILDIFQFVESTLKRYNNLESIMEDSQRNLKRLVAKTNDSLNLASYVLGEQVQSFKNPVFSQDEEFRIIYNIRQGNVDVVKYRRREGFFIPYIEIGFNGGYGKDLPIDLVTVGPKGKNDIAVKGLSQFLKSCGYKVTKELEHNGEGKLSIKLSAAPLRYQRVEKKILFYWCKVWCKS